MVTVWIYLSGGPTAAQARAAFDSIRDKFMKKVNRSSEDFSDYDFERIHHWNWPIEENLIDAVNPKQLFPTSHDLHQDVHRAATSGPHPTKDPILPKNKIELEPVTELIEEEK